MKKFVKASIATAAGITLLLGGTGTFATWNANADLGQASIVAGNLHVAPEGNGVWTTATGAKITKISDYRIVPGETLTYTQPLRVIAEGQNLTATLGLTPGSVAPATPGNTADEALKQILIDNSTVALTTTDPQTIEPAAGKPNTFTVSHGAGETGGANVTVTATVTFPAAGDHNAVKLGTVKLSDFKVSLTQIAG